MLRASDKPLTREQAISRLRALEPDLRARGLASLYLFGSVARNEAGPTSDIDLFCDLDPSTGLGAFGFLGLGEFIATALRRPVDLTTRDSLHRLLRGEIEAGAHAVF